MYLILGISAKLFSWIYFGPKQYSYVVYNLLTIGNGLFSSIKVDKQQKNDLLHFFFHLDDTLIFLITSSRYSNHSLVFLS